jgi:hypothetical protein
LGFPCPEQFNPADYVLNILDEVPSSEGGSTYRTGILKAYEKSRELNNFEADSSDSADEENLPENKKVG